MKRYISAILIPCLVWCSGCTTLKTISKDEVRQKFELGIYYQELFLVTKENNRYQFGNWDYQIKNDTLYAKGLKIYLSDKEPINEKIAFEDIAYFEVIESNTEGTIFLIVGLTLLALLIITIVFALEVSSDLNSCSWSVSS